MHHVRSIALLSVALVACSTDDRPASEPSAGEELPLGDVSAHDMKADGAWGHALECKPIPSLPGLVSPRITISLDGLTLHLTDSASSYDRVFPIGPGKIDLTDTDAEYRESLTYAPLIKSGSGDFTITPASSTPCKTWWTDPANGQKLPVFAGLPFMSWYGNYAIHGPIDNFRAANGGALRRGYVSHGCVRMEAADVLEVYARIKGAAQVPVHVQREPERTPERTTIDIPSRWIGAACTAQSDCNFPNGFCAKNPISQRGFCSARCTQYCTDRTGNPATFCVADPDAPGQGMCLPKAQAENFECRPYDQFAITSMPRLNQAAITADVCAPASRGWVGDPCRANLDCKNGTSCRGGSALKPGMCTMSCTQYCSDQPGSPDTFCASVASLGAGGSCVRQCTPSSNASECPADTTCTAALRNGQVAITRNVCLPSSIQLGPQ